MRIYAVALMAMSDLQDANGSQSVSTASILPNELPMGTLVECLPALIPAESMQAVVDNCRVRALDRWKPDEGWHSHQANIMSVTQAFYDAAFKAYDSGILDMSDEPGQTINL